MKVSYEEYTMAVISLGWSFANWRTVWMRWLFQVLYMWARLGLDLPAEEGREGEWGFVIWEEILGSSVPGERWIGGTLMKRKLRAPASNKRL